MARGGNGRVGNALGQRSRVASGNDAHDDEAIGIATSWGSLVFLCFLVVSKARE